MSRERNMKWLNDRHVIYRRDPVNDIPTTETKHYKYYEMVRMSVITYLTARLRLLRTNL